MGGATVAVCADVPAPSDPLPLPPQQLHRAFEFYDEMVRNGLQPGVNT
jgi:hypothetical protein